MQYEKDKLMSIHKPAPVCALCGGSLTGQAKHPSVLRETASAAEAPGAVAPPPTEGGGEDAEFVRTDYHAECWQKARSGDYLSFWLARRPAPPVTPKMTRQQRNMALLGLFSAVAKTSDPLDEPMRFVLSHLLMRYRALTLINSRVEADGRKTIIFEMPQTEERFEIADLRLADEHLTQTMARIKEYLDKWQDTPASDEVATE